MSIFKFASNTVDKHIGNADEDSLVGGHQVSEVDVVKQVVQRLVHAQGLSSILVGSALGRKHRLLVVRSGVTSQLGRVCGCVTLVEGHVLLGFRCVDVFLGSDVRGYLLVLLGVGLLRGHFR